MLNVLYLRLLLAMLLFDSCVRGTLNYVNCEQNVT